MAPMSPPAFNGLIGDVRADEVLRTHTVGTADAEVQAGGGAGGPTVPALLPPPLPLRSAGTSGTRVFWCARPVPQGRISSTGPSAS